MTPSLRLVSGYSARLAAAVALAALAVMVAPHISAQISTRVVDPTGANLLRYNPATGAYAFGAATGTWSPEWTVLSANWNKDGRTDFFLYSRRTGQWFRATNDGAGGFTYYGGAWQSGLTVLVLDLSGDEVSDVFAYDSPSGAWTKAIYASANTDFTIGGLGAWSAAWNLQAAEFNVDGKADLWLDNPNTGNWVRATNDGRTGFTYVSGVWDRGWRTYLGDFDGDEDSDVLLYNDGSQGDIGARNAGLWNIALTTANAFNFYGGNWSTGWQTLVGDVNLDSQADVILYNASTGALFVSINNNGGQGGFAYVSHSLSPGWAIYGTDVNDDGRLDVVFYDRATGVSFVGLSDGSGGFIFSSASWSGGNDVVVPRFSPVAARSTRVPNRFDIVRLVHAQNPGVLRGTRESAFQFTKLVARELFRRDPKWGLNGKRGNRHDPSSDVIAYKMAGGLSDNAIHDVELVDILHASDDPSVTPTWAVIPKEFQLCVPRGIGFYCSGAIWINPHTF